MKKREEMVMFEVDEETREILEEIKKSLPMFDFEKEIPPLMIVKLATIAFKLCKITDDETNREDRIDTFISIINDINQFKPELFVLMVDMGIDDIFTLNEDNIIVLKEEYCKKIETSVLTPMKD